MKCSKCNSENLEITAGTNNKKQPKWWFWFKIALSIITLSCLIITFITKNEITAVISAIGLGIIFAIGKIQNKEKEEKKGIIHTKAVCKDCGHIEYLD